MHWIDDLTDEQRKEIYLRYKRLCNQILSVMFISFFMMIISMYYIVTKNDYALFIVSITSHGILGGILMIYGNTIYAVKYKKNNLKNKYRMIGLYFGLYFIPLLSSYIIEQIATIRE